MGLEAAQAVGLINSAVLWQGQAVTLVGVSGANAYIETSNSSQMVTLAELDLVTASARLASHSGTFRTPGVFRPQHLEAATCSAEEPASGEHDYSLDACFDPSLPGGLDELRRQARSSDPIQRAQAAQTARDALQSENPALHGEDLRDDLEEVVQVAETCDPQAVAQTAPRPAAGNASNGASNGGNNGGNGASAAFAGGGGVPVSVNGSAIVGQPVVASASFVDVVTGIFTGSPTAVATVVTDDAPHNNGGSNDIAASDVLPAVIAAASLPIPFNPVSALVPAVLSSASVGVLEAPRSKDPAREANFFQALFGPELADNPTSGIVELLVRPTASFASKLYDVRRAVAEVIRTYNAVYGAARPGDRDASIPLNFRSDPERRRIEVSIDPTGGSEAPRVAEGDRQETGFDSLRGPFRSLPLFRLGSDDHRRDPDAFFAPIVAYIPMPSQYLQGVRLGDGVITARGDGRATDRGVERLARRDSANDQHGGSHSDEGEGRGSRGGRGGRDRRQQDQEALYEDELDSSAAA
jgi:uncharacterized membrane protein YgcG